VTPVTVASLAEAHHRFMPDKLWYLQRLNLFET